MTLMALKVKSTDLAKVIFKKYYPKGTEDVAQFVASLAKVGVIPSTIKTRCAGTHL